jgi:DNA-binding SARP family transcriptional activator
MIRLQTLGTLEVTMNGAAPPAELLWKKNIALLLFLARAPKHRCTREQLIGLFWPDKGDDAARQSVREAIRMLRQFVGEDHITAAGDVIQLVDGAVELDTDQFERQVKQRDWARATPLINGEFLEGFKIPDGSGFEDWLTVERSHWRGLCMHALLSHAEERVDVGDELGADEPITKARKLDPLLQRALRALMRRLANVGDRTGALQAFEEFEKVARREGIPLEPETKALEERVRSGRVRHLPQEALSPDHSVSWRRAPLLGRAPELGTALAQWRNARAGRLTLLVVEAESGGGKTRFVEEVATRTGVEGGVIVTMRAVPADLDHPASGLLSLARGLLDVPGVVGANPAALRALAQHAPEWAERFPQKGPDSSAWDLDAASAEVLRVTSADRPHVLIFDDAQWIDPASYQTIERLARDLARAPLLIVLATTPEPAPPKLAELRARIGRDVPGAAITLGKLDHEAILRLVQWALPAYKGEAADRLARRIAADSGGLPLLAVEMCHAIAQGGLDLEKTNGAWPHPLRTLDSTFPGDLPDTIVASIRVGFRCLTKPAQQVLIAAAILGERVSAKRIACATDLAGEALHAALDELEWCSWLVAESRGYTFVARIVRDVVARDMVTQGERQRILARKC